MPLRLRSLLLLLSRRHYCLARYSYYCFCYCRFVTAAGAVAALLLLCALLRSAALLLRLLCALLRSTTLLPRLLRLA